MASTSFAFLYLDDSLEENFDNSTLDEHDDIGEEDSVPVDDDLDNIDDPDVEEHDDTSEDEGLGTSKTSLRSSSSGTAVHCWPKVMKG